MSSLFNGAHTAVNEWANEGKTLTPMLQMPLVSGNTGDPRFNGTTPTTHDSSSTIVVNTPMTGGGGAMAK